MRLRSRDKTFRAIVEKKMEDLRRQRGTDFSYMPPFSSKTLQFQEKPAKLHTHKIELDDGRICVKVTLSQLRFKDYVEVYAEDGLVVSKDGVKREMTPDLWELF